MSWLRIRALIVKEFLAVLRDPRSRFVLIGPPLVQLFIFSFAATLEVKNVTVAVLNQDAGRHGWELVQRIDGSPTFTELLPVEHPGAMERAIDTRQALVGLRIAADFSRRIEAGEPAAVQMVLDGRRSNAAQIAQGYVERIVADLSAEMAAARSVPSPQGVEGAMAETELVPRALFNPNRDYQWFIVPGLVGVLPMLVGLMVTALTVARERELGTFEQLLVSPLGPSEILIGKSVPALVIGVAEGAVMAAAAIFVFGVPIEGALWMLFAAMALFMTAAIGVGLFISSLSLTQQQAILGSFLFMVPAISLSGFATPVENMPDWLQLATEANPLKHFLVISRGLFLKDLPPAEVWGHAWKLIPIAAVTLGAAAWLFRKRME